MSADGTGGSRGLVCVPTRNAGTVARRSWRLWPTAHRTTRCEHHWFLRQQHAPPHLSTSKDLQRSAFRCSHRINTPAARLTTVPGTMGLLLTVPLYAHSEWYASVKGASARRRQMFVSADKRFTCEPHMKPHIKVYESTEATGWYQGQTQRFRCYNARHGDNRPACTC